MTELCYMLWRSIYHPVTARHTNSLPIMLIILEFLFTFLMEVCLNPIIYFFVIYANIWSPWYVPILCTSIVAIHKPFFFIYGIQIPTKHLKLTRIHGNIKNSGKILTCIFIFPFFWGGHQLRYLGNLKYQPPNSIQVFIFNNKSLPWAGYLHF